ncbi:AraC family transcriptional regulator [Bradyrhizobium sp. U87765 SZCCT0131]|uniref:AraC-like ligand-binding domain-containing protein n=1 Tax=unclassified Bradyrhizobium TaxID=2631580 RepID=UPI001BACC099|nr:MULTISPECIES: AraC family transcriptional regulator [unclassified Bradyrhizobium]MBR1219378.1 AraC family transcriptional regulator [Bradyrhizobium sp. U87765 SZCCT0131]MBR1262029.1 AraC family transcriptional regulator [Bradyrhizobium sp. U87765 SZCCT0134]MBR1306118.1 AraC family transcriptional regulator [Bradyrhizobium sp. U87765 SZCCT0110]MBR1317811.1 AraC family transcriptional regulator [Bradyrhizobium sp. U87765 SZCCT0109]MBR1351513.1 AraC family transcriptional regulator [Bradyrhizo
MSIEGKTMLTVPRDPLHRFPTVRTSDPDEFRHALVSIYGARSLTVHDPTRLRTRGNFVRLGSVAIGFSACTAPAEVRFDGADFARVQIGLTGHARTTSGGRTVDIDARQYCITSPDRPATLEYGEDFEHLVLRIDRNALTRKLTSLLGAPPHGGIEFDAAAFSSAAAVDGLRDLMLFLARQLDGDGAQLPPLALAEIEQALIVGLLCTGRHRFSDLLQQEAPGASAAQVLRVEDYIEANWDHPLSIDDLAAATGIAARTLFRAFQTARGYSPMAFVKTLRLRKAREMLLIEGTSVSGAAFRCGFSNLGHFARDYRNAFGERPSATRARARGR